MATIKLKNHMCRTLLNADEKCKADEFDCEDGSCIKEELKCDGAVNCRFRTDEENCDVSTTLSRVYAINLKNAIFQQAESNSGDSQSENMVIIIAVFGVMVVILIIAFTLNCMRKIVRDHKIIRVS
jgi:hypothetical protein